MAVPVPKTWVATELVDAAEANLEWRDTFNFIFSPPRAFAYRSSDFSTTTGVDTLVSMSAELYDPYSTPAHDNSTNPSRMIAAEAGIYQVTCAAVWDANTTGRRQMHLRKNAAGAIGGGTSVLIQNTNALVSGSTRLGFTVDVPMIATDYVEFFVLQTSGGNLNVIGGQAETFMSIRWCAKQ